MPNINSEDSETTRRETATEVNYQIIPDPELRIRISTPDHEPQDNNTPICYPPSPVAPLTYNMDEFHTELVEALGRIELQENG